MYVSVYVCMSVCMYVCMYVCMNSISAHICYLMANKSKANRDNKYIK